MDKKSVCAAALLLLSQTICAKTLTSEQQEFVTFAQENYQLSPDYVIDALSKAEKNDKVLKAIASPWEAKPWFQYRPIFITSQRIKDSVAFYNKYSKELYRATQETGVPAEIIVAIIAVETNFGKHLGNYKVLDSLYSLGFYYPPRAKFFRKELAEYLKLTEEQGMDYTKIKGSYAGAMGWGQFISSSYRHYAIDFDNDGKIDLLNNPVDAIGSVANYFKQHGWKKNQAVAYPAQVNGDISHWLVKDLKPRKTWVQMQENDIKIEAGSVIDPQSKVTLIELEQKDGKDYWVGLDNFYVITRYNHSPLYAMAVYQLSDYILQEMI